MISQRGMVQSCAHGAVCGGCFRTAAGVGGGRPLGTTGATAKIAPCPNISQGWPCPPAWWLAIVGGARDGAS